MPRGDRRGPEGFGPMTGRRMGYCAGYDVPGYANQSYGYGRGAGRGFGAGMGRGMSYGRGGGRGFGRGFAYNAVPTNPVYSEVSGISEKTLLENEIKIIKEELKGFEERLTEISKEDK